LLTRRFKDGHVAWPSSPLQRLFSSENIASPEGIRSLDEQYRSKARQIRNEPWRTTSSAPRRGCPSWNIEVPSQREMFADGSDVGVRELVTHEGWSLRDHRLHFITVGISHVKLVEKLVQRERVIDTTDRYGLS
jgi:hypothetical protein